MLNFRDSFFPYLGLILFIVCVVVIVVLCIFVHTKRVIYWAIGNAIGFFLGYLIAFLATTPIIEKIGMSISIDFASDKEVKDMIAIIVEPIIILVINIIWNLAVLVPVYFLWYKKWIGLHDINKYTDEVSSRYFHHKKGVVWSEKIAGLLLSIVAFYPSVTMIAADTNSYLCSQSNVNKSNSSKNVNNDLSFICSWNKNQELRQNLDGLQGILNLTSNNLDVNLYDTFSDNVYYNYIEGLVHLLARPLDSGYFGTDTASWYFADGNYYSNYDKIFNNSYFSKYSSYLFESKKMINIFVDSLTSAMVKGDAEKIKDSEIVAFKSGFVFPFLCGENVDPGQVSYHLSSTPSNTVEIPSANFKYLSERITPILFENPTSDDAIEITQEICQYGLFSTY